MKHNFKDAVRMILKDEVIKLEHRGINIDLTNCLLALPKSTEEFFEGDYELDGVELKFAKTIPDGTAYLTSKHSSFISDNKIPQPTWIYK